MSTKPNFKFLYHLAEAENWNSIAINGLLSTTALIDQANMPEQERNALLRNHRPKGIRLPNGVFIRDQAPMPPSALAKALDDDLQPADWYAFLNSFVFFWPDLGRLDRQRRACGVRPQIMLTFNAAALISDFGLDLFVSPINSGNARRKPALRGLNTILPYQQWRREGWLGRPRTHPPAEFLFRCPIPAQAPYLIATSHI